MLHTISTSQKMLTVSNIYSDAPEAPSNSRIAIHHQQQQQLQQQHKQRQQQQQQKQNKQQYKQSCDQLNNENLSIKTIVN